MRRLESPRDLPAARRALLTGLSKTQHLATMVGGNAVDEAQRVADSLTGADLYWVTRDMTAVALDGASDLPEWSAGLAAPSPSGLLVWRGDLPPVRVLVRLDETGSAEVPLTGITWSRVAGQVRIMLLTDHGGSRYPAPLVPVTSYSLAILDPAAPEPLALQRVPELVGVTALIGATWIMMQQPTVVTTRQVRPARRDTETADRLGVSRPLVTTVDLRTIQHLPPETSDTARRLTVRHLVRGHWRQQYHPSDGSHRPRWIASYLKGPDGAPLRHTEQVRVWRR